jgi:hypothetical protein
VLRFIAVPTNSIRIFCVSGQRRTIFISCGQYARNEILLGEAAARLVEELTPFRAHFAQTQSSLEGVTNHILRQLNESVGLIVILHPRGQVARVGSSIVRASVWIEQEIAIAAFMNQVLQRGLRVKAYIHESIGLEGLREQVLLNPTRFSTDQEVLDDLRGILSQWAAEISVRSQPRSISEDLGELASCGQSVLVKPAIPTYKSRFDSYVVSKVDARTVKLKNEGSAVLCDVPIDRIKIIWRGDNDRPELQLDGRLQWLTLQGVWKFFSESPKSQHEKEFGFAKTTTASDPVVIRICDELKSRGYQVDRFVPHDMRSRVGHGWEVVYDADGGCFEYEGQDKRILGALYGTQV